MLRGVLCAAMLMAAAAPAAAQRPLDRDPSVLEDAVDVQVVGRELVAILSRGGPLRTRLEKDEKVLWTGSRGRVGAVLTDRRVLAASPGVTGWRPVRRRLTERSTNEVLLGGRLALYVTSHRVAAFDGQVGDWFQSGIGPGETVLDVGTSQSVGVLVTDRRALGFAAGAGLFRETAVQIGETLESLSVLAEVATLRTSRRLLVFRGSTATWVEELRTLK